MPGRFFSGTLQKPIQQFAAVGVEMGGVAQQEGEAVAVGDQQRAAGQAADVVFGLEQQFGVAPVGGDLPDARRGVARNALDAADVGGEFALRQFLFDERALVFGQTGEPFYPDQFVAVAAGQ